MNNTIKSVFFMAATVALCAPASAAIVSTTGVTVLSDPIGIIGDPSDPYVSPIVFQEVQDFILPVALLGFPAGFVVNSYYLFYDQPSYAIAEGSVTFDELILAAFTTTNDLLVSEAVLGNPSATYLTVPGDGIEPGAPDELEIFGIDNGMTATFHFEVGESAGDYARIITLGTAATVVPIPGAAWMFVSGLLLLSSIAQRRLKNSQMLTP